MCPPMAATLPTAVHRRGVGQSIDSSDLKFAVPPEPVGSLMLVGAWSDDTLPIESAATVDAVIVTLS